jgi:septal ring factor EnvC (AmiA/AmiB activator)
MKTLGKTLIALSLSLMAAAPAFASHGGDQGMKHERISERQERQRHRIDQGVKRHQLTRKEVKQLKRQQRDIRYLVRVFGKDGRLTKRERRILNRELDSSSWQIRQLRHNQLGRYVDLHERYGRREHARRL